MSIIVRDLVKRYGDKTIIDGISFEIAQGELVSLLGPSGCGKTTTLRCIAGLETPESGFIAIDDMVVFDSKAGIVVEPYHRDIGMVFQSYAIWPHLTVFENVAFPLRIRRRPNTEVEARVTKALAMVGLSAFRDRSSQQLSGGQQQRVAVARAIVHAPAVLLFDEPLSNLDAKLRDQTRAEIRKLQRELNVATVYVTHDQAEALSLSDRILVMRDGVIRQQGTPEAVYGTPLDAFVADVVGPANFLPVTVVGAVSGGVGFVLMDRAGAENQRSPSPGGRGLGGGGNPTEPYGLTPPPNPLPQGAGENSGGTHPFCPATAGQPSDPSGPGRERIHQAQSSGTSENGSFCPSSRAAQTGQCGLAKAGRPRNTRSINCSRITRSATCGMPRFQLTPTGMPTSRRMRAARSTMKPT